MNFIKHIFSYDFLLYINRVHLERVDTVFAVIAALLIVVAIATRIYMYFEKHIVRYQLFSRVWRLCLTVGLLGAVWYGARYQLVGWFGTHLAFILLLLVGLVWAGYILKYYLRSYKKEKTHWDHKQLKDKYLKMA